MNRRDFGKAVASGTALTATANAAVAQQGGLPGGKWRPVAPGVWRARIGTPEQATPISARRVAMAAAALDRLPAVAAPPLPAPSGAVGPRGLDLRLPLAPGERMYGFGLQMHSFQQRGKKRTIRVNADPRGDTGDSHAPVPFYVTTHGYGVLVDTFRQAVFYCGEAHPRPTKAITAGQVQVNTPEMTAALESGQSSQVRVEVPRCAGADVYLFAGPALRDAVQRYNLFSGGGVLPPDWALGFWYRVEQHLTSAEVLALGDSLRSSHIPCDVLGLEPGWQTHAYSCTFAWEPARFPDPKAFVQAAGARGFRVNLWEHAFTHPASPIFTEMLPHSGDFAVWGGLVPDFAGEPARRVFSDYHAKALVDVGVSGFKLDECDSSDYTNGWSFPDSSRFPSGVDGEQMHAEFGLRYQDAILQAFQQRGQQTFGLVRSSGALATPYPFVLYSDLYDHRDFIRALVNASFSGLLWCPEVRDASSEEDLIRRLQSVVFSPLAMVNAWYIKNPPWKQIERKSNNEGHLYTDNDLETRCREIIGWRMQLLPYLRAAYAEYAATGLPPVRALAMDYPTEASLASVDDAYLIGDRILVAPLFAGEPQRTVQLPPGMWHDFWSGKSVTGKLEIVADANHMIPVFVKANSVVPWAAVTQHTGENATPNIVARVYGDGSLGWSAPQAVGGLQLKWDGKQGKATNTRAAVQWERIG